MLTMPDASSVLARLSRLSCKKNETCHACSDVLEKLVGYETALWYCSKQN